MFDAAASGSSSLASHPSSLAPPSVDLGNVWFTIDAYASVHPPIDTDSWNLFSNDRFFSEMSSLGYWFWIGNGYYGPNFSAGSDLWVNDVGWDYFSGWWGGANFGGNYGYTNQAEEGFAGWDFWNLTYQNGNWFTGFGGIYQAAYFGYATFGGYDYTLAASAGPPNQNVWNGQYYNNWGWWNFDWSYGYANSWSINYAGGDSYAWNGVNWQYSINPDAAITQAENVENNLAGNVTNVQTVAQESKDATPASIDPAQGGAQLSFTGSVPDLEIAGNAPTVGTGLSQQTAPGQFGIDLEAQQTSWDSTAAMEAGATPGNLQDRVVEGFDSTVFAEVGAVSDDSALSDSQTQLTAAANNLPAVGSAISTIQSSANNGRISIDTLVQLDTLGLVTFVAQDKHIEVTTHGGFIFMPRDAKHFAVVTDVVGNTFGKEKGDILEWH